MKRKIVIHMRRHGRKALVLAALTIIIKASLIVSGVAVAVVIGISTLLIDNDWEAM